MVSSRTNQGIVLFVVGVATCFLPRYPGSAVVPFTLGALAGSIGRKEDPSRRMGSTIVMIANLLAAVTAILLFFNHR